MANYDAALTIVSNTLKDLHEYGLIQFDDTPADEWVEILMAIVKEHTEDYRITTARTITEQDFARLLNVWNE